MATTKEFLAEKVYLPGFMLVRNEDYEGNKGRFSFAVREPEVARGSIVHYVTPRGLHICISQAGYCFMEEQARSGKLDLSIPELREYLLGGVVKIIELNQRFRREVLLDEMLQGTFILTKYRPGRLHITKFGFDFGNRAIIGDLTAVIAPFPVSQTNSDLLRIKPSEPKASEV